MPPSVILSVSTVRLTVDENVFWYKNAAAGSEHARAHPRGFRTRKAVLQLRPAGAGIGADDVAGKTLAGVVFTGCGAHRSHQFPWFVEHGAAAAGPGQKEKGINKTEKVRLILNRPRLCGQH